MRRVLTLVVVLTACLLAAPAPSYAGGDPHYHEPAVGECRDMTYDQLIKQSDNTDPVDCTTRHTTKIVAVPQIPAGETWASMMANNWAKIGKLYEKACLPAWETLLGVNARTQAMTAYALGSFIPNKAERDAGARWYRCDVFVYRAKGMTPLKYDAAPLVPTPLTKYVRRCMKAKTLLYTSCDSSHLWKASGSFNLRSQRTYPTDAQIRRQAFAKCPALVKSQAFAWSPPPRYRWKYGYRAMACFTKTRR